MTDSYERNSQSGLWLSCTANGGPSKQAYAAPGPLAPYSLCQRPDTTLEALLPCSRASLCAWHQERFLLSQTVGCSSMAVRGTHWVVLSTRTEAPPRCPDVYE